jgi:cyclophilin family peptidyl-prolyl cis-trans isomerase/HEAT repeat protein
MVQRRTSGASQARGLRSTRVGAGLVVGTLLLGGRDVRAQSLKDGDMAALRQAIVEAEVARLSTPEALQPLVDGVKSDAPAIQQLAVRALGRLEETAVIPGILPLLAANTPSVRAEAANALAQAVQGPGKRDLKLATQPLRGRLETEKDPMVRGVLFEALARLPYETAAEVRNVEGVLVNGSRETDDPGHVVLLGTARGFEALYRVHAKKGPAAEAVLARLRELIRAKPDTRGTLAQENSARVRRLAMAALQLAGMDVETLRVGLKDPDALVRTEAASFLEGHGRPIYADAPVKDLLPALSEAMPLKDESPLVRYAAVSSYGYYLRDESCAPLFAAAEDASPMVSQAAIDALGRGCPSVEKDNAVDLLRRLITTLPANAAPSPSTGRVEWHRAAHALVSLAQVAPEQAASVMSSFAGHPVWQVRMYAARAATTLKDAATLRKLAADDPADNVRSAALTGLSRVTGHADDAIFIAALARSDHQVTQVAARALQGSTSTSEAVPALVLALDRLTAEEKDNTRDARVAILQRLRELGSRGQAAVLTSYLKDFDPRIATLAAETLTAWTGAPSAASPVRPRTIAPRLAGVMQLESARLQVTMETGGTFEMRLFPSEAPATVERIVRLARSGYYNGLTFHRVAPNWVIQGGSPGANEVTGDSPFMVDEVGLRSHTRGSLGISTRGHDTGDAQFFVDLCDNASLDHSFGVWGEVVSGMEVVDGVLEGDVIRKVDVMAGS